MAKAFTAFILAIVVFSGRANPLPIRPAFDPGRESVRASESLRPRAQVANGLTYRQHEKLNQTKCQQELERVRASIKNAHEQMRQELKKMDARGLADKIGFDATKSDGTVKKEDADELKRNIKQTEKTLQSFAAEMEKQQQGGPQ